MMKRELLPLLIFLVVAPLLLPACRGERDPERPSDAYLLFRDALFDGDAKGVWARTDERTRAHLDEHYARLVEMNEMIERYLPATDHQLARNQAGVVLLDRVSSGEELFLHLFDTTEFPADDQAVFHGSRVQEIQMAEDGDSAIILTRGENEFLLVRQEDEEWYVNLVDSGDFLNPVFAWLENNFEALEQTVEDLIAEELRVRERIIAELMGIEE